jgi:predicted PurR-regulated permease PerM
MAEFDPNTSADKSAEAPPPPKKYVKRTAFFITASVIFLILFAAAVMDPLVSFLRYVINLLAPLFIGGVIAYLCDPILKTYEYRVFKRMKKGDLRRGISLFFTVITAFGIVALVLLMMVPQLLASINELMSNYEVYVNRFLGWLQGVLDSATANLPVNVVDISTIEKLTEYLSQMFGNFESSYTAIFEQLTQILAEENVIEKLWGLLLTLFNSIKNLFIGLFIAFYILASKEKRIAQVRKFRRAMFKEKTNGKLEEIIALTHKTFGGFIYGKILDSLVIGILTFVLLTIFEISPYNLLIATFVGITNIIPVFGPFIGAIPSFFVVLISNPGKGLLFLVLILIIQQLDGNIIGPKILGDNTGVSSLCVIIAIAICSTLWGVVGMIIGVPIFAVVIELVKRILEDKLRAKGEPTDTQAYYPADAVGDPERDVHYEHAALFYKYSRSKFKQRVDRVREGVLKHLGRQDHSVPDEDSGEHPLPSVKVNHHPVANGKSSKKNSDKKR